MEDISKTIKNGTIDIDSKGVFFWNQSYLVGWIWSSLRYPGAASMISARISKIVVTIAVFHVSISVPVVPRSTTTNKNHLSVLTCSTFCQVVTKAKLHGFISRIFFGGVAQLIHRKIWPRWIAAIYEADGIFADHVAQWVLWDGEGGDESKGGRGDKAGAEEDVVTQDRSHQTFFFLWSGLNAMECQLEPQLI